MKKRIFWSICLTNLAAVLLVSLCVLGLLYSKIDRDTWQSLQTEARYIGEAVELGGEEYLDDIRGLAHRVTLVAPDGTVLFDDTEAAEAMENHAGRPEIADALEKGTGQATRHSETLGKRTFYFALRLENGSLLRVSATVDTLLGETLRFVPWLLALSLLVVLVSMLLARRVTASALKPINEVDLSNPLAGKTYDELSPFLRRIAAQNREIQEAMDKLRERQQEFDTITESMDEGLIVLGSDATVLSINQGAQRILGVEGREAVGQLLAELNRDLTLNKAVDAAREGRKQENVLEIGERKFRLTASPAAVEQRVTGVVVLLVDETEKLQAESLRREFSANVSHELKTPLTSISGYAEIMQKGLVKPEDISDFAGRIHEEADRLIALVSDIIKLSKLDEKEISMQPERVDLLELCRQTAEGLQPAAGMRGVVFHVTGAHTAVQGIRSILSEVAYNLMDNAVKYNVENGEVAVTVWQEGDTAYLKVADTGAGIPPDVQPRVFERFYRGDTSHSSEISGTGLGLSIVKHGVQFHGGQISLQSMQGKGSEFLVSLPALPQ